MTDQMSRVNRDGRRSRDGRGKVPDAAVPAYLTGKQLALRFAMSVKWVDKMRAEGGGVPFHKFGRHVRYAIADVIAFEEAAVRSSTSDQRGRG